MAEMLLWSEPLSKLLAHALLPLHQRPFLGGAPVVYVGAISGIALDVDTVTDAAAFSVVCACAGTSSAHRPRGVEHSHRGLQRFAVGIRLSGSMAGTGIVLTL